MMGPQFLEYECVFGRAANPAPGYASGWSPPEDGFTWAVGSRAELTIPTPGISPAYLLEIWISPFLARHVHPRQTIVTYVNGTAVSAVSVEAHTVLAILVPAVLMSSDGQRIRFDTPDAFRPCDIPGNTAGDGRRLSFMFHRLRLFRVGEPVRPPAFAAPDNDPLLAFESLGDNCDLGMAQRANGLEPLGLLRFSGQPITSLIRGLDERFEAFNDANAIVLDRGPLGREADIFVRPYQMFYHTFLDVTQIDEEKLIIQQTARLKFLARKFIEDVKSGLKIFVFRRSIRLWDAEILAVHAAINRVGTVNTLAVSEAYDHHLAGTVEVIMPGLFRGYVSKFRKAGAAGLPFLGDWEKICGITLDMVTGRRP